MTLERPTAPDPYSLLPRTASFDVEAQTFADGAALPQAHVYDGGNVSPALRWSGAPQGTRSYAVTCYDPDAPTPSGFWHWGLFGIPADVTGLVENAGSIGGEHLPAGAVHLRNDYGTFDFGGAAPPPGDRPHRYVFAVTAFDTDDVAGLGLDADTSIAKAHFLTLGNVLGRATITGTYQI